jgi:hypothetical protein
VDESVLFEVADFALCPQLCKRLHPDWQARLVGRTESHFVAVDMDLADRRMELLLDMEGHRGKADLKPSGQPGRGR